VDPPALFTPPVLLAPPTPFAPPTFTVEQIWAQATGSDLQVQH